MNWYVRALKKYAEFTGRAHRTEFWMFLLISFAISVVLAVLDAALGLGGGSSESSSLEGGGGEFSFSFQTGLLQGLYSLAVFVPTLAVGARRLHDINRSGWWQLIVLIPVLGILILIFGFWIRKGDDGPNGHGPDPWSDAESATDGAAF